VIQHYNIPGNLNFKNNFTQMIKAKKIAIYLLLTIIVLSTTSCAVSLKEKQANNGRHLGWFKNQHHPTYQSRSVYIFKNDKQVIQPDRKSVKPKGKDKKSEHWDAKK
jgi:hypothetical protein